MKTIRVWEFGGPNVLRLEDSSEPRPGAGQVLVRIHAAGVNPVETYVRSGKYAKLPDLPYTPGRDSGGEVESVGDGVSAFQPGDRVFTTDSVTGTYAEKAVCPVESVFPLPNHVDYAQGAALGIACGAAWRALYYRGAAGPAETVLVHGATGAVGLAVVQMARASGLTVIGSGGDDAGRSIVLAQGAHFAIAHGDWDEIRRITAGKGVDLIIEMLANKNLGEDLSGLARGGRVVVVGSRGPVEIDPRRTLVPELSVLGMSLFNMTPTEARAMYTALGAALESRVLRPVVGLRIPLSDAARAHHEVMDGSAPGKIVLVP